MTTILLVYENNSELAQVMPWLDLNELEAALSEGDLKLEAITSAEFKELYTQLELELPIAFIKEKKRLLPLFTAKKIAKVTSMVDFIAKIKTKLSFLTEKDDRK